MAFADRPKTLRGYDLFFFDCETGGLSAVVADMIEVACIRTDPTGTKVIDEYCAKVFPKKPVDPIAAKINGYSEAKWAAEAIELDIAMPKMLAMAQNAIFSAHNAPFDWAFFETAMIKRQQRWRSDYHKYDTASLAMPLLRHGLVPNLKLVTLTAYFGIEHENAHSAMADVRACQQLFLRLMAITDPAFEVFGEHMKESVEVECSSPLAKHPEQDMFACDAGHEVTGDVVAASKMAQDLALCPVMVKKVRAA